MSATLADVANLVEAEKKDETTGADQGGLDLLLGNGLVAYVDLDDVIGYTGRLWQWEQQVRRARGQNCTHQRALGLET